MNIRLQTFFITLTMCFTSAKAVSFTTLPVNMRMGSNLTSLPPGSVSDPAWLADLAPYKCLRFMDWQGTNGNSGPRTSDDQCVAQSNALGADGWFCVKHNKDDNYIRGLATIVRDNLNPGLKCYIEYSNETWNTANPFYIQMYYAFDLAVNNGLVPEWLSTDIEEHHVAIAAYGHAYRACQIFKIFHDVFGDQMNTRVVKVIASHFANINLTQTMIRALQDPKVNPDGILADAFAIAPYFGAEKDGSDLANAMVLASQITIGAHLKKIWNEYNAITGANTVLIGYEGGQHFQLNANVFASNQEAYNVYMTFLDRIAPFLDLFCHYTHTHGVGWTSEHSWGAKAFAGQPESEAHKYRALKNWAAEHPYTEPTTGVADGRELTVYRQPNKNTMFSAVDLTTERLFDLSGRRILPGLSGSLTRVLILPGDAKEQQASRTLFRME